MGLLRSAFLAGSRSVRLRERAMKLRFVRRAVARFMPGEDLEAALDAIRLLQPSGIGAVLTMLGENVGSPGEAAQVARHYHDVLARVKGDALDAEISLKPTQLGIDHDQATCVAALLSLVEHAGAAGTWVWIDMESTAYTDATLDLYRRARARFPNVGVCVQAYLRRTERDLEALIPLGGGLRLVKGAYQEPPALAFPRKRDVDAAYFRCAERLLGSEARRSGVRAIFGTHDGRLIRRIEAAADALGHAPGMVEFQMLYGINRPEQSRLAARGRRFRVLISYGDAWFPWYMRRLAERPANLLFVLRHLLTG